MMTNYQKVKSLEPERYEYVFGVDKVTFDAMLEILEMQSKKEGKKNRKVTILDKLVIFLEYWYEERIMERIGAEYGLSKGNISKIVEWVEETLRHEPVIILPEKRKCEKKLKLQYMISDDGELFIRSSKI